MEGQIIRPVEYQGHLWISVGTAFGKHSQAKYQSEKIYRVVRRSDYIPPHPDLPLSYKEHTSLPEDHPFRWGYEGMIVKWDKGEYVLTDEHFIPHQPWEINPDCLNGTCPACATREGYKELTPEARLEAGMYHSRPEPSFNPLDYKPERSPKSPFYGKDEVVIEIQPSLL